MDSITRTLWDRYQKIMRIRGEAIRAESKHIREAHMALVHPDGSSCPDGCDYGPRRVGFRK